MEKTERTVGVYLWQKMTMLDVLGPHQFLAYVPGLKVVTFAKTKDPVVTDTGVRLIPDHDFSTCPPLDILLVGGGVNPLPEMQDDNVLSFLRQAGDGGRAHRRQAPGNPPPLATGSAGTPGRERPAVRLGGSISRPWRR